MTSIYDDLLLHDRSLPVVMWRGGIQHNAEWRGGDVLQLQDSEKVSNNFIKNFIVFLLV